MNTLIDYFSAELQHDAIRLIYFHILSFLVAHYYRNQFLDNLTSADAFIHIVDVSGETDEEGKETKNYNPTKDVKMLENELDLWYLGILKKVWGAFARTVQNTKSDFAKAVAKQFYFRQDREKKADFLNEIVDTL